MKKNKVVVLGWDAADWQVMDTLMKEGHMPTLKKFVSEGVRGNIATLDPPLSPMLWTSMATGVRPYKHGILGFVEPVASTGSIRPVSSKSRKVKAIWNMFSQSGLKSNVVGWWPSNPVEPINGCMVSNLYQQERKDKKIVDKNAWDMPEGTVHPERLIESLKELRVHPDEVTGNLIMPFVPAAVELKKKHDERLYQISRVVAHCSSLHAAFTELIEKEDWDFAAVYHDAIDHFSHHYMKFYPPKLDWVTDEDYEIFNQAVIGIYRFHDMMLERVMNLTDKDTTIVIVSDHGFHSDHLRPRFVPQVPSGPAIEHSQFGMFAARGPNIKKNEKVYGSTILDLTPTLLAMYDLPIGKDMDGKVLTDIFIETPKLKYIESWEKVDGDCGSLSGEEKDDPMADQAAMQQLIELGYIDEPSEDASYSQKVATENNFYLAKSLINGGEYIKAYEVLTQVVKENNTDYRYLVEFANLQIVLKKVEAAEKTIQQVADLKVVSKEFIHIMRGKLHYLKNEPGEALIEFRKANKTEHNKGPLLLELGKILLVMGDLDNAADNFKKALAYNHRDPNAHNCLGLVMMKQKNYEEAVDHFLEAIDIIYHFPYSHYNLGECLALMGEFEHAEGAFEQALIMKPSLKKAYRWLLEIQIELKNEKKQQFYQGIVDKMTLGQIRVVTGLPSDKLLSFLKGFEDSIVNFNENDIISGHLQNLNLEECISKTIYLPFTEVMQLPSDIELKLVIVNAEIAEASGYLSENEVKKETDTVYDLSTNLGLQNVMNSVESWLDQQPDLDIERIEVNKW
ncbi:MAG: putative AlkP superfamily phosphohydrolase/phosphomutase/tetratricopeptide (TPR) repeat protein [Flavobacteriaceae bacterium]|jgi:predicted AlkP superfamily phosphohydrolase/phosphomutase/tetratricopeptide (TPR) repeat protein